MTQEETTVAASALPGLIGKPQEITIGSVPAVAIPPCWRVELHPELMHAPQRTKRNVEAHQIGGFISYANRFKTGATALYCADEKKPRILARIDDHQIDTPSHVEHTASYNCPLTEEWQRWTAKDAQKMNQQEFAEFIEDNIADVVEPSGAAFFTAVTTFSEDRKVEVRSALRLDDGRVNFQYSDGPEKEKNVAFPSKIKLGLPVFNGMDNRYEIEARFKYRLNGGALVMWFELERPDLRIRAAYDDVLAKVEEETGLHVHRAI